MDDKKYLTGESNLPISVPPADTGWADMRKRLDDEMPAEPAIIHNNGRVSVRKLSRLLILLLAFSLAGFMVMVVSNNKLKTTPGNYSGKNEEEKNSNEFDNAKSGGTGNVEAKADQSKKDSINAGSPAGDRNTTTPNKDQSGEIITGTSTFKSNGNISSTIKSSKNSNGVTKSRPLKAGKGKSDKNSGDKINTSEQPGIAIDNTSKPANNNAGKNNVSSPASIISNKPKDEKKSDSIAGLTPPSPEDEEWKLKGGLSWNLQVPTASTGEYFTGANTKSQPYTIILPGAWIQAQHEKHLLTFELDPFASNLLPQQPFRTFTTYESIPDTTVITVQTRTLQKLFGASVGLGYGYNISGNWWLGGGLQFFWWRDAVASSTGEIQKVPVNGSPPAITPFKLNYAIEDEWSYFSKFQACINAEGIYKVEKWQAGLRMGLGFTPLAKNEGPSHPLRFDLLYRLKLFNIKTANEKKQAGFWSQ